jgi:signal transduction histidine kinase
LLPFKRLHNSQTPGSGLGLAICDKILRAHEGRIWVESDGAHGVTVRFTLPLA